MRKFLKNGAGCPTRTGDLMITNRNAGLFSLAFWRKLFRDAPLQNNDLPKGCKLNPYRKAMLEAINEARRGNGIMKDASMAEGLRCIREFEAINNVAYDPFSSLHRMYTAGMGPFSATFTSLRRKGLLDTPPIDRLNSSPDIGDVR